MMVQVPLLNHFHPSVVLHAEQLLNGEPISASTDLEQHSLNHFLDRFVYREVKKSIPTKGSSMMQSGVSGQDRTGRIVMKKGPARGDESLVNSDLFKNKVVGDVPVDQVRLTLPPHPSTATDTTWILPAILPHVLLRQDGASRREDQGEQEAQEPQGQRVVRRRLHCRSWLLGRRRRRRGSADDACRRRR
jgi:hypothetical protein